MESSFSSGRIRIGDIKLREHVAWWQCHLSEICHVPRAKYDSPIEWIVVQFPHDFLELVDTLPSVICMAILVFSTKVPPLESINGSEVTLLALCITEIVKELSRSISVPNMYTGF